MGNEDGEREGPGITGNRASGGRWKKHDYNSRRREKKGKNDEG